MLSFVDALLERWSGCGEYLLVLVKVGYLNMLAIYHLKIKQYSYSLDVFGLIFDLYLQKPVDCTNEPFLTSLSNYLSFLSRTGKGMQSRRT